MKIMGKLQSFGKVMMIPIAAITFASFFMGLGGAFTNSDTIKGLHLSGIINEQTGIIYVFQILKAAGEVVFKYLPLFFCLSASFGLAKKEQGFAALSGAMGYLAFHVVISQILKIQGLTADSTAVDFLKENGMSNINAYRFNSLFTTELGIFTYKMSIFGGLFVGIITSQIHNKFYNTKLPPIMAFFSGTRIVPIITLSIMSVLGAIMAFVWKPIGYSITDLGFFIRDSGLIGTFVWGALDKALISVGLHHLITVPIRYTELGGTALIDGQTYAGTTNIFLAQLASPTVPRLLVRNFSAGRILYQMGGLPGAALAMYHCAKPEKKKEVKGLLIPAIVTMILFGVTEPIEFTFLFISPALFFLVHVPLSGLSVVLGEISGVAVYGTCLKDMFISFLQPQKNYILPLFYLTPIYFGLYYFIFKYLIIKFNMKTPGREDAEEEVKLYTKDDYKQKNSNLFEEQLAGGAAIADTSKYSEDEKLALNIIAGLGGKDNIQEIGNCITRLRVTVTDPSKIVSDDVWKKQLKALGVIRKENAIQVVYGTQVTNVMTDINAVLD